MSVTTAIENISNHLKNAYDELQGLGADLTNVNKNIENISMVLDDIYDSMPQVSGEGTSLTLDNTRIGKIKSTLKGNTSQSGTPTPTSPIPINVVSGDNKINVVGKNFLENQYLPIPSADTTASYTVKNAYLPEGTYTLATTDNSTFGNTIYIKLFKEDKQVIKENGHLSTPNGNYSTSTYNYFIGTANNLTYIQFTIDDNYYVRIGLLNSDNTKEVMLVKGSEIVRTYEPYQGNTYNIDLPEGMELCKTGNYQDYFGKSDGRNLFDLEAYPFVERVAYANGEQVWWSGYSGILKYFPVEANTTYTFSNDLDKPMYYGLVYYDDNKQVLSYTNAATRTFTTPNNCKFIRFAIGSATTLKWVQIEKGSSATDPQLYGVGKWCLHKKIGKVILDGSESWNYYTDTSKPVFWIDPTVGTKTFNYLQESGLICYCDYFQGKGQVSSMDNVYDLGNNIITFRTSYKRLVIRDDSITSVSDFGTWLSSNNIILYYVLATPTNTEITYQPLIDQLNKLEKAQSKDNQTNINQENNNLPFIINASALLKDSD